MKKSLRTLALGAAMLAAGAMSAQDVPTVTQNWFTPVPTTVGDFRSGSGLNGKVYVTSGKDLYAIDETSVTKIFTSSMGMNKGFALDEAGNIVVGVWPTSANNWATAQLIKPDGTTKNLTLTVPANSSWTGNRYDRVGRAVGDFLSEEGGVFYIAVNTNQYPIPVWIANGEVKNLEQPAYVDFAAANTTAFVQPSTPMSEMDETTVFSNYYYYTGSSTWNIYYPGADFEKAETLPRPKTGIPEGWGPQTQPGFDVFDLGGKKYIIRMSGTGVYQSQFLIHDMDGNVIFHTEYTDEWNNIPKESSAANVGSGLWARKVSDYKVELYQVFKCQNAAKSFAAMYTITIPEPEEPQPATEYYVRGAMTGQDWPALEEFKFTRDGENYSWTPVEPVLFANGQQFKIAEAEWSDATTLSAAEDNNNVKLTAGSEYTVTTHTHGGGNMEMDANIKVSNITLTKAENGYTMVVTGTPDVNVPENFYISYDLGAGWDFNHAMTKDGKMFTADFTVTGETGYITFTTAEMNNWTVADGGARYGSGSTDISIEPGTSYPLVESSDKCFKMPKGDYTATITVADNGNLSVVFTSPEPIVYQVYFDNSIAQWSNVYVYYWGGSAPAMNWEEAREMTAIDRANNMYTYIFKDGVPANLIFKSDNGQQTKDLEFKNEAVYKAVSQDVNDGNKWSCELGQTGVENVEVDADVPAVYYNLSGVRVANPANGLYIVVRGTKVTKEYIR